MFVIYGRRQANTQVGKRDAYLLHQRTVLPHGGDERRDSFLDFLWRVEGVWKRESRGRGLFESADDGRESTSGSLWLQRCYDVADDGETIECVTRL